jgi:hypothetical protein
MHEYNFAFRGRFDIVPVRSTKKGIPCGVNCSSLPLLIS